MKNQIMKCLFCPSFIDINATKPEHIIPQCIDGTTVTYHICSDCNSFFGTEVDSLLNRNRQIWDARKLIPKGQLSPKTFHFSKSWVNPPNHPGIRISTRSNSTKILRTDYPDGSIVFDPNCTRKEDPFIHKLKQYRKKYSISENFIETQCIAPYLEFKKKALPGSFYKDPFFSLKGKILENSFPRMSEMPTNTPTRFIAKACVEFASLLNFLEDIANADDLVQHARNNHAIENLSFHYKDSGLINANPHHIIAFTEMYFILGIYGKVFFAVDISWKMKKEPLYISNDLKEKKLRLCFENEENSLKVILDREVCLKEHEQFGLKTHI